MGYYIVNINKMNYKADYQPSELLCPITYTWVTIDDDIKKTLEMKNSIRLAYANVQITDDMDFSKDNVEQLVKNL